MAVVESPAPPESSGLRSPVVSSDQPPSSALAEPPASSNPEVLITPNPPKPTTPQRTRRQETPPPTTATRLRSHITPTKKADAAMHRAQEMRLALLPPAQPQPSAEPSLDSTHTFVQPGGVPLTPRVIPPTPIQRSGGFVHYDYAEPRGSQYPLPGDSRQSSMHPDEWSIYNMKMLPVQDRHDDLGYSHSDDGYRRSPTDLREGSIPSYQRPAMYADPYGPPHMRLSPRTDYVTLPGPSRHPLRHPNQHAYRERSLQPSERATSYNPASTVGAEHVQRSQSPPATSGMQSDQAPSRSPRADNTSFIQPPAPPLVTSAAVPGPTGPTEMRHELPAPAITAPPSVVELAGGSERPPQQSSVPSVLGQSTSTSSTPAVVAASTPQASTPATSDVPKKAGRPSNKSLGLIASGFSSMDEIIDGLASQTGMTRMQLIARWLADAKGANSHTTWNIYLKYFAANKDAEAARVPTNTTTAYSTAFRAQCYAKYQEEVSDWQERLALFDELELFSTKGMTVSQRNRAFRKFEGKLRKMANAGHTEFNFETAYVLGGSVVQADQGLSASYETADARNFFAECCRAPDDLIQDHFKAHIGKQVSNAIVEEKWADASSPVAKAETDAEGDFAVIRHLWTGLLRTCDDTWPDTQFIWKDHLKRLAEAGMVTYHYPNDTMLPGDRKPGNLRAKGIADMWKSEQKNMLAALRAPGAVPAKYPMRIEKVGDDDKQKLLDGSLPVLICAPLESASEQPRKIYYRANGTDDHTLPAETSNTADNRRTTRSTGAATIATSSKGSTKVQSSFQPQKRPEIHIFSSKNSIADNSDDDIIELPSPGRGKTRSKKRPLPDDDEEVAEGDDARGKHRPSLRSLYDSDGDEKAVTKKGKRGSKKRAEVSVARTGKQKDRKTAADVVRGGRGGRAVARGGKPSTRAAKSRAVITDTGSSDSEPEVPASDPVEMQLAAPSRPKPRPAYQTSQSVIAKSTPTSGTAATTSLQPLTDMSTESSLTTASETSIQVPPAPNLLPKDLRDVVSVTNPYHEQGPPVNPIPSMTNLQVADSALPQASTAAIAPPSTIRGDFFEGGLLPPGGGEFRPQGPPTWDPRPPYTNPSMQRNPRAYTGHREPRFDPAGREPLGMHLRPTRDDGWDVGVRREDYRNQERRRGYKEAGWDIGRRDEYLEVGRGGREEPEWDTGGREDHREVRRMGYEEGWPTGGRYITRRLPETRQMGREAPSREEPTGYGPTYNTMDYYGQGPTMRLPSMYPDPTTFNDGRDYLHPPPSSSGHPSNTSTPPFAELQHAVPNTSLASTTDNTG